MCNLYGSTKEEGVRKVWRPSNALAWGGGIVAPRKPGAFIRRARDDAGFTATLQRWAAAEGLAFPAVESRTTGPVAALGQDNEAILGRRAEAAE